MARIRTIKPSFFTSHSVAALSLTARLTFVGLWTHADDEGRAVDDARLIKAALWPLEDKHTAKRVEADLVELAKAGLIHRYETDGRRYLHVRGFSDHQRVSHAQESSLPVPPPFTEPSVNERGMSAEDSPPEVEVEGNKEEEGKGTSVERSANGSNGSAPEVSSDDDVTAVFEAWLEATNRTGATRLDPKRRRLITAALKGYPRRDVIDAVRGWRNSPHHCGDNDNRTVYNDLGLLLRDSEHIERFRDLERRAPSTTAKALEPAAWGSLRNAVGGDG